jgi:hypothetical protein
VSPEELRTFVEAAVRNALTLPWWSYAAAFGFSLIGAYMGAYIRRKAEQRATQENFENIRNQLRKTTQDTEEIKTALLRRNWLTQQQWSIRERHYMSLLQHLGRLKMSLSDRSSYFIEPGSEHNEKLTENEYFQSLSRAGHESYQAIRELIGPASVFLSSKAIASLEQLVHGHWHAAEFSICTAEYVSGSLTLVDCAYQAVLAEAKNELAHHSEIRMSHGK